MAKKIISLILMSLSTQYFNDLNEFCQGKYKIKGGGGI